MLVLFGRGGISSLSKTEMMTFPSDCRFELMLLALKRSQKRKLRSFSIEFSTFSYNSHFITWLFFSVESSGHKKRAKLFINSKWNILIDIELKLVTLRVTSRDRLSIKLSFWFSTLKFAWIFFPVRIPTFIDFTIEWIFREDWGFIHISYLYCYIAGFTWFQFFASWPYTICQNAS